RGLNYFDIPDNEVYKVLAKRLDIPEPEAHFAQMHTFGEVERAIAVLEGMLRDARNIRRRIKKRKRSRKKQQTVPAPNPEPIESKPVTELRMNVKRKGEHADPEAIKAAFAELKLRRRPFYIRAVHCILTC